MHDAPDLEQEIQQLVWDLVDDQISRPQFERLETLLAEDTDARRIYINCMQLHTELRRLFSSSSSQSVDGLDAPAEPLPTVDVNVSAGDGQSVS